MHTESRPDTLAIHSTPPGDDTPLSHRQIKSLDCSTINKYLIKALCHGLSPSETMYGWIDISKATKMSRNLVFFPPSFIGFSGSIAARVWVAVTENKGHQGPYRKVVWRFGKKAFEMLSTCRHSRTERQKVFQFRNRNRSFVFIQEAYTVNVM